MEVDDADFSGYATKAGLKCSDGRTIMKDAFSHQDGAMVPLVWHHMHDGPENVLGKAKLENRADGVYAYAWFNSTEKGQTAKALVEHGDVVSLSIFANKLVEKGQAVLHGAIREVSLVLSGANPGALIENIRIAHSDDPLDIETDDEAAFIFSGEPLEHGALVEEPPAETPDDPKVDETVGEPVTVEGPEDLPPVETDETVQHAEGAGRTVEDIYNAWSEEERDVVTYMITKALEANGVSHSVTDDADGSSTESNTGDSVEHSSTDTNTEGDLTHQEGTTDMTHVFEGSDTKVDRPKLSHDQLKTIIADAQKMGSFKESFLAHAQDYGIENIDILFPDARTVANSPEVIGRRQEWVADVLNGTKHSPFSRIKSTAVDLTADEARAKGYVKGNLKKDEIIKLLKRVTTPTTIYKKQKLDRDDVIDITDLDVVAWLKAEMRVMLDEELARAVLVGDGRETDDEDHIDEDHIRPIAYDNDMYAHQLVVASELSGDAVIESILRARTYYKGTGTPTLYTTDGVLTDLILLKDKMGRRLYETEQALAAALRVSKIVTVEVMQDNPDVVAILVNLTDYTLGADRGGNVSMFDDFDIDYNQYKYLIETRVSGALTKPKSAIVVKRTLGTVVTPASPSFNGTTNTITFPSAAGVVYSIDGSTVSGDVVIEQTTDVEARPATGYSFPPNTNRDWTFVYAG